MKPAVAALALCLASIACAPHDEAVESRVGGDVERGRVALRQHACGTCHVIPGVTGADALVGPPLNGIGTRRYIAGILPNTPANLRQWIQDPHSVSPLSAMPDLGVNDRDALDMIAYLYTLP